METPTPPPESGEPNPAPPVEPIPGEIRGRRPLWQRLVGIRPRRGRFVRFVPTLWGWCLIAFLVLNVAMIGFAEYSMQPDFCRSCHLMEPYYQAWHASTHRNVPCSDCHFDPGLDNTLKGKWQASSQAVKFITNTYGSKPHAEIHDASCMRIGCHEKRLLEGKVNWTIKTPAGQSVTIRFDHTPHLGGLRRGKQLRCVSCHSQIVQGQHIVVTLDTCFLCHFKGYQHGRVEETLGGCKACHDAPKEKIRLATGDYDHARFINRGVACINCHADSLKGDGEVPRQVCWNCHNKPQDLARYGDSSFMHQTHITEHKVECSSCHVQIQHNLRANAIDAGLTTPDKHGLSGGGVCAQCHEQSHGGPLALYRGSGGRGVPDMPSPMYRAKVNCIACHQVPEQPGEKAFVMGQTYVAAQSRCDYCHGNEYGDYLANWKAFIKQRLDESKAAYQTAQTALGAATLSGPENLRLERLMDDAAYNIRLVDLGRGVHNVNYAAALLSVAADNSDAVARACGATPAPRKSPTTLPAGVSPVPVAADGGTGLRPGVLSATAQKGGATINPGAGASP